MKTVNLCELRDQLQAMFPTCSVSLGCDVWSSPNPARGKYERWSASVHNDSHMTHCASGVGSLEELQAEIAKWSIGPQPQTEAVLVEVASE